LIELDNSEEFFQKMLVVFGKKGIFGLTAIATAVRAKLSQMGNVIRKY